MRQVLCFGMLFFLFVSVPGPVAWGQVVESWVARYDGPGSDPQAYIEDGAWAVAVDPSGYVYVAGASHEASETSDFATIKYDPQTGDTVWVRRYDGAWHGDDGAVAIALDVAGNVLVTGGSFSYTASDYLTIKYDSNGNELWTARYYAPGNMWADYPTALAVDSAGNVYVTGSSYGSGLTSMDYATVKYDADGHEVWVARYNGPHSGDDNPSGIALDAYGNVYVTGGSYGSGSGSDYATIKYDRNGNLIWVSRYNGPGNRDDGACALAVDEDLNVYVTGTSDETGIYPFNEDYATIKYDNWGNQLWVVRYDSPGNGDEYAAALGLDREANVYVTGVEAAWGYTDYSTIKYDSAGAEEWVAHYNGPANGLDWAEALAVDFAGNIYVTGRSVGSESSNDYATIKYDSRGNQQWVARYNGTGNGDDWTNALAVDGTGNVYVTGRSDGVETYADFATLKYAPTVSLSLNCLTPTLPRGGRLRYEATATNNSADPHDFLYWAKVKLPNGNWYRSYVVPPTSVSLGPHESRMYPVRQTVPTNAPLGRYEYWGYVGSDTSSVWSTAWFAFTVTSELETEEDDVKSRSPIGRSINPDMPDVLFPVSDRGGMMR